MIDACVCCGEYVAEGQQVCTTCQNIPKKRLARKQLHVVLPVVPDAQVADLSRQLQKAKEEAIELIDAINSYNSLNISQEIILSEAFDTLQAIFGVLAKIDDETLQIACVNHDEKLNRKYNATGKTLIKL